MSSDLIESFIMIPELRMRERELKKECIDAAREMKQTQRGREGDETKAERQRGREHRDKVNLVK